MDAYVIWTLQDAMTKHERRIHDAGKKYAQHVQSVDPQIVNQAEGKRFFTKCATALATFW